MAVEREVEWSKAGDGSADGGPVSVAALLPGPLLRHLRRDAPSETGLQLLPSMSLWERLSVVSISVLSLQVGFEVGSASRHSAFRGPNFRPLFVSLQWRIRLGLAAGSGHRGGLVLPRLRSARSGTHSFLFLPSESAWIRRPVGINENQGPSWGMRVLDRLTQPSFSIVLHSLPLKYGTEHSVIAPVSCITLSIQILYVARTGIQCRSPALLYLSQFTIHGPPAFARLATRLLIALLLSRPDPVHETPHGLQDCEQGETGPCRQRSLVLCRGDVCGGQLFPCLPLP